MPESPEVSFLAHTLHTIYADKTLKAVSIKKGRYLRHGPPQNFDAFVRALPAKVTSISKKGKTLFFAFDNGWTMISKLGLTGWWYSDHIPRFLNMAFMFDRNQYMFFSDSLSYGTISFTNSLREVEKELAQLAPDILDDTTKWPVFAENVARLSPAKQNMALDVLLMEQGVLVSGIGNYLKAEILYDAKIAPQRKASTLTDDEWRRLFNSAKKVTTHMLKSLLRKGNPNNEGENPEYEQGLQVYKRKEDQHGNVVQSYKSKNGRTTYWVPAVQM